jgi:hypothetical protein
MTKLAVIDERTENKLCKFSLVLSDSRRYYSDKAKISYEKRAKSIKSSSKLK